MPTASLVIPTRNRAALLRETIENARQAGSDLEIVVVDDASEDETPRLCAGLGGVRYIRLEGRRRGTSHARNVGIEASSAEFIAFLDDDDLRLPGSIDPQLAVMRDSPRVGLVYGLALLGDPRFSLPTGQVIPDECPAGDVFWRLLEGNFVPTSTVVVRRRCLREVGLFKPELDTLEDYDLWVRLAERYHFGAVPEPLAVYRTRSESSGQKTSDRARHDRHFREMYDELLRLPRARAESWGRRRRTRRHRLSRMYNSLVSDAAGAVVNGDRASARAFLLAAMRFRPLHVKAHGSLLWLLVSDLLQREF